MQKPATIREIASHRERVRAVKTSMAEHAAVVSELAQITRDTVREMRNEGMTYRRIAAELDISVNRVKQLLGEA